MALWLDFRAFQNEPSLPDSHNFVIINSQLHDQFDAFKRDNIRASYSNIPLCSLLMFYCCSKCPHHLSSKVKKYGRVYLELYMSEVDKFIMWVDDMREKYYGADGERIFENAARIMSTYKPTGTCLYLIRIIRTYILHNYYTLSAQPQQTPLAESDGDQQGNGGKLDGDKECDDEPPKKQRKVSDDQLWGAIGLGLDEDDRSKILNQKWLTDKHMNACSVLLKQANPSQSGLHHTLTLAKKPHLCASPEDFVQLAHIEQSHWVCFSSINCPPGVVDVYDSAPYSSSTCNVLLKQVAAVAKCQDTNLEVRFVDVQVQEGTNDCGLFAIAFATALCNGVDPYSLSLDQKSMREHLLNCFEEGEMLPFPLSSQPRRFRRRRVRKVQKVPVYCHCRLPWDRRDTSHGSLAQCRKCKEWFHEDCANIPQDVFVDRTFLWCCRDCAVYL